MQHVGSYRDKRRGIAGVDENVKGHRAEQLTKTGILAELLFEWSKTPAGYACVALFDKLGEVRNDVVDQTVDDAIDSSTENTACRHR